MKGLWFTAARLYCDREFGRENVDAIADQLPEPHRSALVKPQSSLWYPEESMQVAVDFMYRYLARSDDEAFIELIERCTEQGVGAGFRAFLRISTAGFVVKQIPAMWRQIRRGPGRVEVEERAGTALVHYRDFPYFDDRLYVLLTPASIRSLLRICTRREPRVEAVDHGADYLTAEIHYFG